MKTIIVLGVVALIAVFIISQYNRLIRLNITVDEAWSQIEVQLKRRADLIPNLVETVKGYAAHEKEALENVVQARAASTSASTLPAIAAADGALTNALRGLLAVAEAYPQLQANQNFLSLQAELSDTEDKIMAARRFYNGGARELNIKVKQFPQVIFGGFGFKPREYFEVVDPSAIAEPPQVKF